jgi:hypothetical protein
VPFELELIGLKQSTIFFFDKLQIERALFNLYNYYLKSYNLQWTSTDADSKATRAAIQTEPAKIF